MERTGLGLVGWGGVGSICVIVSGGDNDGNTPGDSGADSGVDSSRVSSSKGHGEDGLGWGVCCNVLDARDDTSTGSTL